MSKKYAQVPLAPRPASVLISVAAVLLLVVLGRHGMSGTPVAHLLSTDPRTLSINDYDYDKAVPVCPKGWVLQQISTSMQAVVEKTNAQWYDALPGVLRQIYNANAQKDPDGGWQRFAVMMPALPEACPSLKRIGGDGDGGKLICGLDQIPDNPDKPCIVYSIGSDNNWAFEEDIVKTTSCQVFTFDCTVNGQVPSAIQDRVSFYPVCLGTTSQESSGGADSTHKSLRGLMEMLGHDHITLLKADIEGYEFDLFAQLLSEDDIALPEQISFELHYYTQMAQLDWHTRTITTGELAFFARSLYDAGYRVIARENNPVWSHCAEFTVVRFRCPLGPRTMEGRVQRTKRDGAFSRTEDKD